MAKLDRTSLGALKTPTASKRQQADAAHAEDDNEKKMAARKGVRQGDHLRHLLSLLGR